MQIYGTKVIPKYYVYNWKRKHWEPQGELNLCLLSKKYFVVEFMMISNNNKYFEGKYYNIILVRLFNSNLKASVSSLYGAIYRYNMGKYLLPYIIILDRGY